MLNTSPSFAKEAHQASTSEQRIAALHSVEELKGLTLEELRWVADAGTERFVDDGELIFSQGAPPHHLILVLAGEVVIKRHTSSPVSLLTGRTGRITGKTPFSRIRAWNADGRASDNVWLREPSRRLEYRFVIWKSSWRPCHWNFSHCFERSSGDTPSDNA
jgi:hypothetical protein